MGSPKAQLVWHGQPLLVRVSGLLARAVDGPVVVAHAPGQELPDLPAAIELVADVRAGRGPLEGIAAGLRAIGGRASAAFVSSTDAPLLHPAFVRRVAALLDGADVVVPRVHGRLHPLAAAYRTDVLPVVERLLAGDRLRVASLLDETRARIAGPEDLLGDPLVAAGDPGLDSLVNVNTPEDWAAIAARPEPEVVLELSGALAPPRGERALTIRAATLGAAARAASVELDARVAVTVDGAPVPPAAGVQLAQGERVTLWRAPG
jgi:molybdopterin-guanine dinucleotide biosynthesis protein A